ncbi:MAG: Ribosomal small subunit methyltransferase [Myxococcaceae bacterium]|nr:Ribosomal small subunit methyltransferase [Myxococcaceae bacterium]
MDRTDLEGSLSASQVRRLYASTLPELGVEYALDAEALQHARVLRLAVGDRVQLFDGRGQSALVTITHSSKGALRCVGSEPHHLTERTARVVLVQCMPRAGKLDDIVRMTTELGVGAIALAVSEYSLARAGREDYKADRLERIAIEAARQSEQAYVPQIMAPRPLAEVLAEVPDHAYRAAFVERTERALPLHLEARELWLVIGPEGGLSPTDRDLLRRASFVSTALGRSILRTETAAVVGVALALERFGRSR